MSPREIRNAAASVHQRLKDHSAATGRLFNEVLLTYGIERFLYRLARSSHGERFVLKGGLMLMVWKSAMHRPTKDIDLLGHMPNDPDVVAAAIRDACAQSVEDDGLSFAPETVCSVPMGPDRTYDGVRVTFEGCLARAVIHMQIDVGFGDVVVPRAQEVEVPSILGFPAAHLLAYPRETMVAEKLHAMVYHDEANSRVRDFLDVWLLSRQFEFGGDLLLRAVRATFEARVTAVDASPFCFSVAFAEAAARQTMWTRFLQRSRIEGAPTAFSDVVAGVAVFAGPILEAIPAAREFDDAWLPPGPWQTQ